MNSRNRFDGKISVKGDKRNIFTEYFKKSIERDGQLMKISQATHNYNVQAAAKRVKTDNENE